MTPDDSVASTPPVPPRHRGFWQRRLVDPIVRQLTQGVAPQQISLTLAIGFACGLFPFLGFTWMLNLVVGLSLRLNQAVLQTLNQLLTPIHLPMILVYVRFGEWIWRSPGEPFAITELISDFAQLSLREFLHKFGWAGIHAATGWLISVPFLIVAVYYPIRPVIERLARVRLRPAPRTP